MIRLAAVKTARTQNGGRPPARWAPALHHDGEHQIERREEDAEQEVPHEEDGPIRGLACGVGGRGLSFAVDSALVAGTPLPPPGCAGRLGASTPHPKGLWDYLQSSTRPPPPRGPQGSLSATWIMQ